MSAIVIHIPAMFLKPHDPREQPVADIRRPCTVDIMPRRLQNCRADEVKQAGYEVIDTLLANVGGAEDLMRIALLIEEVGLEEYKRIVCDLAESRGVR